MTHKIICASTKDGKDAQQKKNQPKTQKNPRNRDADLLTAFSPVTSPYKMVSFPILITSGTGKGKNPNPIGQNQLSAGDVPHNSRTMCVIASTARAV